MASPQALGGALTYNPFLPGDTNAKLFALQRQSALAQALQSEGLSPLDTKDRTIGGVGYAISPFESLAKLAQGLVGTYGQQQAAEDYGSIYNPQGQQSGGATTGGQSQPAGNSFGLPPDIASLASSMYGMEGGPRAVAELVGKFNSPNLAGPTAYNTKLGESAAGNAPVGQMPSGMVPPSAPALQQYRQDNGMAAPPIDNQRQSMGLPVGTSTIPPMDASQLSNAPLAGPIPAPQPSQTITPRDASFMPNPLPGESNNQYQARLKAAEAGATEAAKIAPSGATAEAKKLGEDLADATKTYSVAAAALPRAMQRFSELRNASKDASSGAGVSDAEDRGWLLSDDWKRHLAQTSPGQIIQGDWSKPFTANANQKIDQAAKQGILAELGPQLQGLKGNRYLEMIASGASGLDPADPADTKVNAINGLQDQYISNLKSLADQRRQYGDPSAPSDMDIAKLVAQHADPAIKVSIITPDGKLGRIDPGHLVDLVKSGGQIR